MKVESKKLDKLKYRIEVEVRGEEFVKEKDEFYRSNSKNFKVPGFRPGSAPLEVLEKHHGKILKEEFLKQALPLFYHKALEQQGIAAASLPSISDVEITSDHLRFSATFEVKPKVELEENLYKGITIKDKKVAVEEVEIEKVLTKVKENIVKITGKDASDEVLARWASYPSLALFREAIRTQLMLEKLRERRSHIDNQIKQHLLKNAKLDLPVSEIERHHQELVNRELYALQQYRGLKDEELDKYRKEIEDRMRPIAEEEVKFYYLLHTISQKEGLKADDNFADAVLGFILNQAEFK